MDLGCCGARSRVVLPSVVLFHRPQFQVVLPKGELGRLQKAAKEWGSHNGASRAFLSVELCDVAEQRLASWLGVEDTLIYPSVTLANAAAHANKVELPAPTSTIRPGLRCRIRA